MNGQRVRFRVGLFVLGALILLGVLITLFGRLPNYFKTYLPYTVRFANAAGVSPGTPVRRSGVRIGEVRSVTLNDETGEAEVHILVDNDHPIRRDEQPVIAHGPFGGDVTIDLVKRRPPPAAAPDHAPVEAGAELPGGAQPDVSTLLTQTSGLVPTTQETLNEIRRSLQLFEPLAPQMQKALEQYQDLARSLQDLVPDLRKTNDEAQTASRNVGRLADHLDALVPELRRTNQEVQTTSRTWNRLGERLDVLVQTNEDKLVKTLDNFNDMVVRISNTFSEENQRNLAATLKNARTTTETLDEVAKQSNGLVKDSRQTVQRLNGTITQANDVLNNLQQTTKPMAERSNSIVTNLDESSQKLNRVLSESDELLRGFGRGDGTLQKLMNDPSLYNNLNDAACMLVRIMPRVDRILADVEVFADKIARHPESLGVGGAVRPSAGLKDVPPGGSYYPPH